jgi:hypothetical protein
MSLDETEYLFTVGIYLTALILLSDEGSFL